VNVIQAVPPDDTKAKSDEDDLDADGEPVRLLAIPDGATVAASRKKPKQKADARASGEPTTIRGIPD
jgi:hypothetical protein